MKLQSTAALALTLLAALLILPTAALAQSVTYTYSYEGPPLAIFRDSANIITVINLWVPRAVQIQKVTANVEIDYPRPGDLNVFLYSAIATRTKLLERNCDSQGSLTNVTFDDSAPTKYSDVCPAAPGGTYRGNEPLSNYNGQVAFGIWSLAVENNGSDDFIGYLRGFTISFTGTPIVTKPITGPFGVANAAGFQQAVVAPGEMINISGINLGPTPAVNAPSGDLPATLGGTQVTFDGTPAAIAYASPYILTVQVPFNVQPGLKTAMKITYQSQTSDPVNLDVFQVVPGLYTQSANGQGLAVAVNQDGNINSITHPASRGSYVTIYAAGLGSTTPPLNTGQVTPAGTLYNTTSPVSAIVDGQVATVSFAGAAPSYAGLYQINLVIPKNAGTGLRSLTIFAGGGAPSQNGVSIFIQ